MNIGFWYGGWQTNMAKGNNYKQTWCSQGPFTNSVVGNLLIILIIQDLRQDLGKEIVG